MKIAVLVAGVLAATPVVAQPQPTVGGAEALRQALDQRQLRYQIRVMERVLEQAVEHGAQKIALRMQALAPSTVLFTGPARARGFRLEGYGVFFDVQAPTLRRSVTWSFRTLSQYRVGLGDALQALRQHVQSLGDPGARDSLEQALRSLEVQVGPLPERAGVRATVVGTGGRDAQTVPPPPVPDEDPGDAYAVQLQSELIGAMLEYSGSLLLDPDEWLTIAASGAERSIAPRDPVGGTITMLRIRGRDLAAFRARDITRDDAIARVETQEF